MTNHYCALLIGATGVGKSTFGNFLLGKSVFDVAKGMTARTTELTTSEMDYGLEDGTRVNLTVIDTPALADSNDVRSMLSNFETMNKAFNRAKNGIDVIFLIMKVTDRLTENHKNMLTALNERTDLWPRTIVVFTNSSEMGSTEAEQMAALEETIRHPRAPNVLKWLITTAENCNGYFMVECHNKDPSYSRQMRRSIYNKMGYLSTGFSGLPLKTASFKISDSECKILLEKEQLRYFQHLHMQPYLSTNKTTPTLVWRLWQAVKNNLKATLVITVSMTLVVLAVTTGISYM